MLVYFDCLLVFIFDLFFIGDHLLRMEECQPKLQRLSFETLSSLDQPFVNSCESDKNDLLYCNERLPTQTQPRKLDFAAVGTCHRHGEGASNSPSFLVHCVFVIHCHGD